MISIEAAVSSLTPTAQNEASQYMLAFGYTDHEYLRICRLLRSHAGIHLAPSKKQMAFNRLVRLVRESDQGSFRGYLDTVEQQRGDALQVFLNAMTTNVTSFFRERHHFEILTDYLRSRLNEPIRIWSAGCSSGQEVWSMVIALDKAFGPKLSARSAPIVLASDIDTEMLDQARSGSYQSAQLAELDPADRGRYFEALDASAGHAGAARIRAVWRQWVEFRNINLSHDAALLALGRARFDIIFCRNVMIYFSEEVQRRVIAGFHKVLKPKGLLCVGHAESLSQGEALFLPRGRTCFERREPTA